MTRRAPLVASSLPPRVAVVAALILAGSACEDTETSARPEGWSTETHSKDVDPDYTTVFDTSVVHRIDIEIAAADYAAMNAELTERYGELGSDAGRGVPTDDPTDAPPRDDETLARAAAACDGLGEGDTCTVETPMGALDGACTTTPDGFLCVPEGSGPGGGEMPDGEMPGGEMPGGEMPGGGPGMTSDDDPMYVEATVRYGGDTWTHVGIRYKGNSSLWGAWGAGSLKLPFRLNFDRYEDDYPEIDDQRFYGFEELSFSNGHMDNTYLRDALASEYLEAAGIPAPQAAFYQVYLDAGEGPVYLGLYTMLETVPEALVERVFGSDDGNLYKPEGSCANWTCFDEASFEAKTNEDETDWSDVQAAVAALNDTSLSGAAWREALEATIDPHSFLRWLAANTLMGNWDAYGGAPHNYYVYGDPSDEGRLVWLPWDHTFAFNGQQTDDDLLHTSANDEWPLIRYLLDDATYRAAYLSYAAELWETTSTDALIARAEAMHALIAPYVTGDAGEQPGYTSLEDPASFESSIDGADGLASFLTSRWASMGAQLTEEGTP